MNQVHEFELYKDLVGKYKKGINNLYYLPQTIKQYIEEGKLYNIPSDDGCYFLLDEGRFFELIFAALEVKLPKEIFEKNICCTFMGRDGVYQAGRCSFADTLVASGLEATPLNYSVRVDLKAHSEEIVKNFMASKQLLEGYGFSIIDGKDERFVENIHRLWDMYLPKTHVPGEHYDFMTDVNSSIRLVYDNQKAKVAGVIWWVDKATRREGRHIVIDGDYRGMKLGSALERATIYDALNTGLSFYDSWIAEDNAKSWAMHERIGCVKSGMVSEQFVHIIK